MKPKNVDLTGQRFGKLVAIEKVGSSKSSGTIWKFECDCGNIVERVRTNIVYGKTGSCGCGYRKNRHLVAGYKIGMLTLLQLEKVPAGKLKNIYYRWHALCDCGVSRTFRLSHVLRMDKQGHSLASCGCQTNKLKSDTRKEHGFGPRGVPRDPRYSMWVGARQRSRVRQVPFDLEVHDIPEIPEICPLIGVPLKPRKGRNGNKSDYSPTLDREVPELGYVKGNISIISDKANRMKNNASFAEFEKLYFSWKAKIESN